MTKATKLEAPEGGWGILVCIGMALPFSTALACLPSFGLVFGDFLKSINAETKHVALITSAFFCSLSLGGLFSGPLFKRFGIRRVGLFGAFNFVAGSIYQIFVTSVFDLVVAFGLLQGIGFGIIVPTAYTTFNNYFVKKRVLWMSFAQTLIGLGGMFYPVVMHMLRDTYGFRGCLALLAAYNSHAILGMLIMQPVEWHMRRVPVKDYELQKNFQKPTEDNEQVAQTSKAVTSVPLLHKSLKSLTEAELEYFTNRSSSIVSMGNWSGPIVVSDASPPMSKPHTRRQSSLYVTQIEESKKSKWRQFVDFLDLDLLKQPIYVNLTLGTTFALYSDVTFFTLEPLYLFELGFTEPEAASIIAIGAAADLASRVCLALSAVFIHMPSRIIYMAGAFFTVIARFAFLEISGFTGMACITAVMGFFRTWVHVLLPLVFAEYLPQDRFSSGYGLYLFLHGQIFFIIGPIVGYLSDHFKSYVINFHILNFFMAMCVIPWGVEMIIVRYRKRKTVINAADNSNGECVQ